MLNTHKEMLDLFMEGFSQRCVIFIGYSFFDTDISSFLYKMRNPSAKRGIPWYAVFPRDDDDVRRMYDQKYGIRQINRTFCDFLHDLDLAVDFIPAEWKFDRIQELHNRRAIQ